MNYSGKLRILLDSTYLLPIVGVEVEGIDKTLLILRKLRRQGVLEVYYTPFNIIEILGKISKLKYDQRIVLAGLKVIYDEFIQVHPTIEGYIKALELKSRGFKDLIDLLLYTTSLTRNLLFLTRDYVLINFLQEQGESIGTIIYENDFIKKFSDIGH